MDKKKLLSTGGIVFVVFLLLIILTSGIFVTIQPGEKGVLFQKFGGGLDKESVYDQGFHVVAPWNRMIIYDVRVKEKFEKMHVLANNGLDIDIEVSIRYRVNAQKIGYLHDDLGKGYEASIIIPEIRSSTRRSIGQYTPEELYASKREAIQHEIFDQMDDALKAKYIDLDAVLIRSIILPSTIKKAIERKLEQEQQSQEYEFRLITEEKEKQRKKIEAEGIEQYQTIVSRSLSTQLLKWQGIEATKELANSNNAKIVVVGGTDGLPLILN